MNYRSGPSRRLKFPEIRLPEITDFIFENFPPRPTYIVRRTKLVLKFKFLSTRFRFKMLSAASRIVPS